MNILRRCVVHVTMKKIEFSDLRYAILVRIVIALAMAYGGFVLVALLYVAIIGSEMPGSGAASDAG